MQIAQGVDVKSELAYREQQNELNYCGIGTVLFSGYHNKNAMNYYELF